MANLQVMLKIYAIKHYLPFTYNPKGYGKQNSDVYVTDTGLEELYAFIRTHSLDVCRMHFSNLFVRATDDYIKHPEIYPYLNNFRGTTGTNGEAGTKQRAVVVRKVKRCTREYEFDSIKEARQALFIWLSSFPIEEFTLYRVRTQKGSTFREKIPLIVSERTSPNTGKTDWRNI